MSTGLADFTEPAAATGSSVFIAAADQVTARRLATLIGTYGLVILAEGASVDQLLERQMLPAPDVTVLAPVEGSVDAIRQVRAALPETRIVLIASSAKRDHIRKELNAGADGIVLESELEACLEATLYAVRAGQLCVPKLVRKQIDPSALSFREKQILGMVVMGFTNSEIAAKLYLAESTVKSHLSSAFSKLGVRSRSEAAALILDPDQALGMGILALGDTVPVGVDQGTSR